MPTPSSENKNPIRGEMDPLLTSGFAEYPSGRDDVIKNAEMWIRGKRKDDAVYPFWRIHDGLYDLTEWVSRHPGGKFWIEVTQGTDITEVFETSHLGDYSRTILEKYYVKSISTPRNSPFTFKENGFYKTLQRKVTPILNKVGKGPTTGIKLLQDSLLIGFLILLAMTSIQNRVVLAIMAGFVLNLAATTSHNFYHQKDNWRMYIFDMMFLSSREWRISHALSHHPFPNTIYDFEVSVFEPLLNTLPKMSSPSWNRYYFLITSKLVYSLGLYWQTLNKIILVFRGDVKIYPENFIPFIQFFFMMILNGSVSQALWLWFIVHTTGSICFLVFGLTAAHHHVEIYHEGDMAHPDKDWGLLQIMATRERGEIFMNSEYLAAMTFGNHTLHHLFPTVDHSKLSFIQDVFLETCREFNIKFKVSTPWEHIKGLYLRMAIIKPNNALNNCF